MAERMQLLQITDQQTAVLAFWEAHNQVNARLAETIHDPYFPKVQFPPASLCAECSASPSGQFDTDHVFGYLMRHYRRVLTPYGKLRLVEGEPAQAGNRALRYQAQGAVNLETRKLGGADVMFYGFVCVSCAAMLISCLLFLSKRKLKIMNFIFVGMG